MKVLFRSLVMILAVASVGQVEFTGLAQGIKPVQISEKRALFSEAVKGVIRLRLDKKGNIFLLNRNDASILMYSSDYKFIRRIGSFGQGPEDLRRPVDFSVSREGDLVVADSQANSIKTFSAEGKFIRGFSVNWPLSVDVLGSGELVVVSAAMKSLIEIYSVDGHLLRRFGNLVPTEAENTFPQLHSFLNRGALLVDQRDNIFWTSCYLPNPVIRKFSSQGEVLLEFQPKSETINSLSLKEAEKVQQNISKHQTGADVVIHRVQVNSINGDIWVFPSAPELNIYDANGVFKATIALKAGVYPVGVWDAVLIDHGQFIIANVVIGCYLFQLPDIKAKVP